MAEEFHTKPRLSVWGNNDVSSSSFDPQARTSLNYVVPTSRYSTQVRPSYVGDYRSVPSNAAQPPPQNDPTAAKSTTKSCKEHVTVTRVIGILVGLVLTGVPLAVMITLYVQLLATSNNTTASAGAGGTTSGATTTTTSVNLPSQCSSSVYAQMTDATRSVTSTSCCPCDSGISGWYRITGGAGTRLATSPVSMGFCSTSYPAWYNGSLPTTTGATSYGTGCASYSGNLCHPSYSVSPVMATNCNGFYVFYLTPFSCSCCSNIYPRYCTV